MKKFTFAAFLMVGLILLAVSCQKEEFNSKMTETKSVDSHLRGNDASLPDLIIEKYETDVTGTTTLCSQQPVGFELRTAEGNDAAMAPGGVSADDGPRPRPLACPNISCFGGKRTFTATITIKNIGTANLLPGEFAVRWNDFPNDNSLVQWVSHNGIPVGGTLKVSRKYYMGPCDCVPPARFFKHIFNAFVDDNNDVKESDEGNNQSMEWRACDGC